MAGSLCHLPTDDCNVVSGGNSVVHASRSHGQVCVMNCACFACTWVCVYG
eukprot:m.221524 g.221524  ORF g.221524 m.221524 type:complete len:50 (-) comp33351_c0_seq2:52-201(-)